MKPAQEELNAALRPIFAGIERAYLIHDDLILATENEINHIILVDKVVQAIAKVGLMLNPSKCTFGCSEISFWG